jgi:hypothetical protein
VLLWLRQFDPERIDYKFLDRENEFRTLDVNKLELFETNPGFLGL